MEPETTEAAPAPQLPSIGRIVHYTLSEQDVQRIKQLAGDGAAFPCNPVREGTICAALVVATFGGTAANLRVIVDGVPQCDLWVTSASYAADPETPRTWRWPARV